MASESTWILLLALVLTIVHGVESKKGFAVGFKQFMCGDFAAWENISWWYDWQSNTSYLEHHYNCTLLKPFKSAYVPMIWGKQAISFMNISDETRYILGFNEPNHFGQSNLTGQEAATLWREVEARSRGKMLVSPSASGCKDNKCHGDVTEWFDTFFLYCQGCRVDYLATHIYDCNADDVMKYLTNLYKRYELKIWVTEFACPYSTGYKDELRFMQKILPRLEQAHFVFRYSWYMMRIRTGTAFMTRAASLLQPHTSTLTALGQYYNTNYKQG